MKKETKKHSLFAQIKYILDKSYRDNIPALAGQSAFFLLLSAIPLILFVFSMISLLTGKDLKAEDFSAIPVQGTLPYFDKLVNYIVESVHKATSGTAIITAIVMLWSAGKGMYCITDGILRIYRSPNNKFWLLRRIYAMASSINHLIGDGEQIHWLTHVLLQLLLTVLQVLLMTWALKLFLRNKVKCSYTTMRALIPGMLITVIAWKILTFGVVYYLRHFAVSSVYGSLAGVFMVMIWVYFLTYLLLYGVQINFVYRHEFSTFRLFKRKKEEETQTVAESTEKE